MDLSIIIPTHNRAALMTQAVRSAFALHYPADCYEIIVVDNASTDNTQEMLEALQNEDRGTVLRYVREDRLGLHNARHAGARDDERSNCEGHAGDFRHRRRSTQTECAAGLAPLTRARSA